MTTPEVPEQSKPHSGNAELLQYVADLTFAVENTQAALEAFRKSYAPRDEVTRDRRRAVLTVLTAVLIAITGTTFLNNREITSCFLQGSTKHSAVCNFLFPGYNESIDKGNKRLDQFQELLDERATFAETNRKKIEQIEQDIAKRSKVREEQITKLEERVARLEAKP